MYYARVSFAVGIFPPQLFEYKIPAELAAAVHEGSWVEAVFAHRRLWGVVDNISQTPQFHGKHHELLTAAPSDSELRCWALALSRRLAACYAASLAQAYKTAVAFPFSLERKHSGPHAPDMNEAAAVKNNIALSAQQQEALQTLTENSVGSSKPVYLWGPAGSGKTYVLLRLIQELLRQGRSAIYLVPEISLTPQFIELLQRELSGGHVIAAWHSGVARSRKKTVWEDILAGKTRLVLGTRSAVFLPLKNLGAVILDEEQDGSYKQEMPAPCYHAGEVALWRAKNEKAMAVFASATPSIECYRAIKNGEMICAGLDERYCARPMPIVKILPFEKQDDGLDEAIVTEVKKTIAAGRHVLIYHNRRGFSRILRCEKCKTPVVCSQCRLPLTLHKLQTSDFRLQTSDIKIEGQTKEATHEPANSQTRKLANILRCHHCGIRKNVPQQCAVCGAPAELLKAAGFGTQKIASEIEKLSGCPVSRLDRDTAKHSEPIYADFKSGQSKILVGTKLVAKGWHFQIGRACEK
ncbi:MAG: primosomal protein N', partial [Elusimicrobia bacterium]|nr:primosomal protein N' [Elusimicrobiota bacterium]